MAILLSDALRSATYRQWTYILTTSKAEIHDPGVTLGVSPAQGNSNVHQATVEAVRVYSVWCVEVHYHDHSPPPDESRVTW